MTETLHGLQTPIIQKLTHFVTHTIQITYINLLRIPDAQYRQAPEPTGLHPPQVRPAPRPPPGLVPAQASTPEPLVPPGPGPPETQAVPDRKGRADGEPAAG